MPPKRRRRFQGLYYHSSPPKVLPMNDQLTHQNGRRRRDVDDFSIKLSTIRIWMHEKDIGKLTRILWAGQGNRLRQQASTNPRVKRFLAAVPYVMNEIKNVHQAVIDNNLETLQAKLEPPVPAALITGKDANGLNVIHKAAGLGHTKILEYLISIWPEGANEADITGKTPLHWAASAKNNMRCYTLLTQAGCDEEAVDYKSKTPSYYRHKPQEIERAFLVYVPEAPRVSPDIATDWDALSDEISNDSKKPEIKISPSNGINGRLNEDSIENTSEVDLNDGLSVNEEEVIKQNGTTKELEENGNASAPVTPEDGNNEEEQNENNENQDENNEKENNANTVNETAVMNGIAKKLTNKTSEREVNKPENEVETNGAGKTEVETGEDFNKTEEEVANEGNKKEPVEGINKAEDQEHDEYSKNGESDNEEQTEIDDENNNKDKHHNEDHEGKQFPKVGTENDTNEEDEKREIKKKSTETKENVDEVLNERIEAVEEDADKVIKPDENPAEDKSDDEESEKTDVVHVFNEARSNGSNHLENAIPAHLKNEHEKRKANKILQKDQETGEKLCLVKPFENEKNNENAENVNENEAQKQNSDNIEEDDDEDVVVPASANSFSNRQSETSTTNDDEDEEDQQFNEDDYDDDGNVKQLEQNQNTESPTSSLAIEGFVHGESEDNTVQSQSAALINEESHIQQIITSGDMEQLAQIVLNGDGSKLLDMQSPETDIQAFLNNVPNYMSKIRRVHEAARDGSLLSLQQALDRRKFAIAKDEISPNGATPLHVAVLFGHSDIVRYLAARFPETTTITDNDGRAALHYAAVIKDNGHFYNMLTQLGANTKTKDKLGNTPQFYFESENSEEVLTYRQLLSNFGAEELEAELLSDQGEAESQSFQSNPIFKTEQGNYLANTLAEPLIEALTEIANKRPDDPISYLTTYLQSYMRTQKEKKIEASSSKTNSTAAANSNVSAVRRLNGNLRNSTVTSSDEIEEDEADESGTPQADDRDEHGQSMLHFACARSHRRGGLQTLIEESNIDITYRDELYRTARDVSLQANQTANAKEIDRYVLSLAVVGDLRPFEHFARAGYDHIIDISDDNEKNIIEIVEERGHEELVQFLHSLRSLEELREELHQLIRDNKVERVKDIVASNDTKWVLSAKNYYGRTALHIAVLKESEEIVEHFVELYPDIIKIGDNLERSPLHYAMGTNAVESLSRILINKGAKRTAKDLKGRQPSYYFMNKADILRLQEEEEENR